MRTVALTSCNAMIRYTKGGPWLPVRLGANGSLFTPDGLKIVSDLTEKADIRYPMTPEQIEVELRLRGEVPVTMFGESENF